MSVRTNPLQGIFNRPSYESNTTNTAIIRHTVIQLTDETGNPIVGSKRVEKLFIVDGDAGESAREYNEIQRRLTIRNIIITFVLCVAFFEVFLLSFGGGLSWGWFLKTLLGASIPSFGIAFLLAPIPHIDIDGVLIENGSTDGSGGISIRKVFKDLTNAERNALIAANKEGSKVLRETALVIQGDHIAEDGRRKRAAEKAAKDRAKQLVEAFEKNDEVATAPITLGTDNITTKEEDHE